MKSKLVISIMMIGVLGIIVTWWCRRPGLTGSAAFAPKSQPITVPERGGAVSVLSKSENTRANTAPALSPGVRTIIDSRLQYAERVAAARALTNAPAEDDLKALYSFLLERSVQDDSQESHVVKNTVMDVLTEMQPLPGGFRQLLTEVYRDRNQHIVIRDYAVQHLAFLYRQIETASDSEPEARHLELEQTQEVLWEALGEADSGIAGTALLGLARLSSTRSDVDRERIGSAALQLADSGATSELTRITAVQVCAQFGVKEAMPLILRLTKQGETMPLRIAAIGALGMLGDVQVVPLLNELQNGSDERLRVPARRALTEITQRESRAQPGKHL